MESRGLGSLIVILSILILFGFYKKSNEILTTQSSNIPPFIIEAMLFFKNKYHTILYLTLFLFAIILFINIMGYQMDPSAHEHIAKVYTMENFESNNSQTIEDNTLDTRVQNGLCTHHEGDSANLELDCNELSETTCNTSNCCGWLKTTDGKSNCVAGTSHGPKYKSNVEGNKLNIDQYYYKNKCYGKTC